MSNSEKIAVSVSASLGECAARQGPERRGEAALDVGDCKANGLRAKVDADQARLGRKAEGEIFDRDRAAHRRERRYHWPARESTGEVGRDSE